MKTQSFIAATALLTVLTLATPASAAYDAPDAPSCPGQGGNVGDTCEFAVGTAWGAVAIVWPFVNDTLDSVVAFKEDVCTDNMGNPDCDP